MTKNVTNLLFTDADYTIPSKDRNLAYTLSNGETIYLSKPQYDFMCKEYWQDKKIKYLQCRCMVSSKRGGLKRCPANQKCNECSIFLNGLKKPSVLSLESLSDESEFEIEDNSVDILEDIIKKEQIEIIAKAVDSIPDAINKYILKRWMYENATDVQTAKELGLSRKAVGDRRLRTFRVLKEQLEKLL